MPSRLVEHALFPDSSRFPELDTPNESEQDLEEDPSQDELLAPSMTGKGAKPTELVAAQAAKDPVPKTPAAETAGNKSKVAKTAAPKAPAAKVIGSKTSGDETGATTSVGTSAKTYAVRSAATKTFVAKPTEGKSEATKAAVANAPTAATTSTRIPPWKTAVSKSPGPPQAKTIRSDREPTSEGWFTASPDQDHDNGPPSWDRSSSLMMTVGSLGDLSTVPEGYNGGEGLGTDKSLWDFTATSGGFPSASSTFTKHTAPRIHRESNIKQLCWECTVVTVVSVLIAFFVVAVVVELIPSNKHRRYRGEVGGRQLPSDIDSTRRRRGIDELPTVVSKPAMTTYPRVQPTGKPVFTLADYEETKVPGGEATPAFECDTEACRWQSRLVDEKLDFRVNPCIDFYGYVCSGAWEHNGDLPYRAEGRSFVIRETTRYLQEHLHSMPAAAVANPDHGEHSFLDHSSLVLNACLNNTATKDVTQWDGVRGLLRAVGLADWPYDEPPQLAPQQPFRLDKVLKLIDRQLAVFPIFYVVLRKLLDSGSYVLHLDAPRSFLFVQYEMQRNNGSLPYNEIIRQVLTLWKTLSNSNALAEDVTRFESQLLEASQPFNKAAWKKDVTYPVKKFPRLPKLRVDAYLSHLRKGDEGEVVVLNPVYASKLYAILRTNTPRTILNFLGVQVVVAVAPLLPQESIPRDLIRIGYPSFQHSIDPRTQSCFHLVNRLFPHGFRWILRDIVAKNTDLDRQWAVTTKSMVTSLAHTFRTGTTWMQSPDTTNAIKRLKALRVGYLAGQEREEDIDHYYASVKANYRPDNLVSYYGELLSQSLEKYWTSSPDGANYDARFSERSTELDSEWTRSPDSTLRLYLTSSSVASASLVTRANYPSTLFSLLAADVTRALFLASMDDPQWSSWTQDRFQALQYCLLRRYKRGVRKANVSAANARDFLADILADNAAVKPLMAAFRHFSRGALFVPGRRSAGLTITQLFFVNYAAGFCAPKSEEARVRERMQYRIGLPPSTRVNLALLDLKEFRDAFNCSHQLGASRCPVWNRDGKDSLADVDGREG
ncbi:hypothetical protein V5799_004606 [Amblyomma americanum]|uniref:M13 family peptidase n=1 Tax=Amblyomma americanum TaxID=6943 RepID=A0AAQ4D5M3_AMBAM